MSQNPETDVPRAAEEAITSNDVGGPDELMAAIDATIKPFGDGDLVTGRVVKIDKEEVLVDIGYKSEGVIPLRELSIAHDVDPSDVVSIGEEVECLVLQKEDKEGRLILSKKRATYERAWARVEEKMRSEEPVEGRVIEVVKGGLIVDIGLRGFLPASLVDLRRVKDLDGFVGQALTCKIIELDKNRNNVVLSRRAHLEEASSEQRKEFLEELKAGEVRKGKVSSIVNFGAFVDLGGIDGLIHVSELSWRHVEHPSEIVQTGDEIEVEVLDVDLERERVSLSLKNTQEDPWQAFARSHDLGDVVEGRVTKTVPFGAFVEVANGIEGLIHISELADEHVELPEEVVEAGQEVKAKIVDIDLDRRRISLSLKQASESAVVPTYTTASDQEIRLEDGEEERGAGVVRVEEIEREEAPAEAKIDEAPAEAKIDEAPAEAKIDEAPAEAEIEEALEEKAVSEPAAEAAEPAEPSEPEEAAAAADSQADPPTEPQEEDIEEGEALRPGEPGADESLEDIVEDMKKDRS